MKRCSRCLTEKAFADFPKNARLRDGHDSWCLACRREVKTSYRQNPAVVAQDILRGRVYERDKRHANNPNRKDEMRRLASGPEFKKRRAMAVRAKKGYSLETPYRERTTLVGLDEAQRRRLREASEYHNDPGHRETVLARNAGRRAQTERVPAWASRDAIQATYVAAKIMAAVTGIPFEVDHLVPLKHPLVCGLHCEANLVPAPARVNRSKGNRHWPDMPA